jgi:hypothetical protein
MRSAEQGRRQRGPVGCGISGTSHRFSTSLSIGLGFWSGETTVAANLVSGAHGPHSLL